MDHSYEEIRSIALDLLAGRERATYDLTQYQHLLLGLGEVFQRRENRPAQQHPIQVSGRGNTLPSSKDCETFLEVFWGLFREGIITIGRDNSNREFPWFRLTGFGRANVANQQPYFFHDVDSYEKVIRSEVPDIDAVTLIYLKEAMQAFRAGCILSATVMLGVASEHTFLLLAETVANNASHAATFANVEQQRTILQKVNKFKNILDQQLSSLPGPIKEDLDTQFAGILSIIRTFRNQAGHPTGTIIDREQTFVLLHLFVPYCKKMYQLMAHFT